MSLQLRSDAFADGDVVPEPQTCEGEDVSPPLTIDGVPEEATSLALVVDDPDAPAGTWVHWVLWGLPPTTAALERGASPDGTLPEGAREGENDFGNRGYGGPCPPSGEEHRYFFKLYALDGEPGLEAGATKEELMAEIGGMIVDRVRLTGRFRRG